MWLVVSHAVVYALSEMWWPPVKLCTIEVAREPNQGVFWKQRQPNNSHNLPTAVFDELQLLLYNRRGSRALEL